MGVVITDAYTVQFLLEGTLANPPRVTWRESGASLTTLAGGVSVGLWQNHDRAGTRVSLSLRRGAETFSLHEPLNRGWLTKHYPSPDDERLAGLMADLWRAAHAQSQQAPGPEEVRDRLYRQLLFES